MGVTVIHTTIGSKFPKRIMWTCLTFHKGGLDQMTSAADFNLISWRNFFGLSGVVVAVMIPVGIRWYFGDKVQAVAAVEAEAADEAADRSSIKALRTSASSHFSSDEEQGYGPPGKGKGVDRDWLMEDVGDADALALDDEPLPPPPPPLQEEDGEGGEIRLLGDVKR